MIGHRTAAEYLDKTFIWCALFVDDLAALVRVCGSAVVGVVRYNIVEHNGVCLGAHGFVLAHLEGKARLAILAVIGVLFETGAPCASLSPAKSHPVLLGVHFHATLCASSSVLLRLEPAEVTDGALVILIAGLSILSVGSADGLEGPLVSVVAVEAFDAVSVLVARIVLFRPDAGLLADARLALTRHKAATSRV